MLHSAKQTFRLAWVVFLLALSTWFVLRGVYKFGPACDLLIVVALAAQAWLLFLPADKCQ